MTSANWKQLHEESTVACLHSHPTLKMSLFGEDMAGNRRRPLAKFFANSFWPFSSRTHFDKLDAGSLNIQLSTAYVPEEQWFLDLPLLRVLRWLTPSVRKLLKPDYFTTTMGLFDLLEEQIDRFNAKHVSIDSTGEYGVLPWPSLIRVVKNAAELDVALLSKSIAVIHSVEGAHSLQGPAWGKIVDPGTVINGELRDEAIENLEKLHARGVAYLTIAHFYPNCCVNSPCFPYPEYGFKFLRKKGLLDKWDHTQGLTPLGEIIVTKMLELGMLIDTTHLTPVARARVYEIVDHYGKDSCVISSHTGAYSVNPDPYCLRDWEIKWMADHGCAIGVIFMNYWLSPTDTHLGLKYLIQTIEHMARVGGPEVVALGTDFDGFTDPPDEIKDMSELPRLTRELVSLTSGVGERTFSDDDVSKILGGNALRVLRSGWTGPTA
jgi:microsomal dipeptidase-like Zn-dependent dipeptidase